MTGNTAFALAPDHSAGGEVEYAEVAGYAATAGSAQESSSADTAEALNSEHDAGNATTPVYFENGLPKAISYSIGKTVPSNAIFTDTTYTAGDHISIDPSNEISVEGIPEYAAGSHVSFTQDSPSSPFKINATWRGIQNNLTSTSTTDSLSANMGKSLNDNKAAKNGSSSNNFAAKQLEVTNVLNHSSIDWLPVQSNGGLVCYNSNKSAFTQCAASEFVKQSSIKYKKNVTDMTEDYANKLLELRPVKFDYINELNGLNCYGLIAEEVAEVEEFPVFRLNNSIEGIDYTSFIPQLIKLAQIQDETIKMLEDRIKALEEAT